MSIQHTTSMGDKAIDVAAINIARLCCAYIGYLHAKKQSDIFSETLLRVPMIEYAQSRHFQFSSEFRLNHIPRPKKGGGSYKKIDVVMAYNKQALSIEYKFPNLKNNGYKNLINDVRKIIQHFTTHPDILPFTKHYGFIMIIASADAFSRYKPEGVDIAQIRDEAWLKTQGAARNLFDVGDAFKTEVKVGSAHYVAQMIKVLDTTKTPPHI